MNGFFEEPRRDLKDEVQIAVQRKMAAWANTSRASELRASMHEEELTKKLREKGEEKDIEIISDQSSDIEMEDTEQTDEKGWTKVGRKSTARKSYTNQTEKKGETLENRSSVTDKKKNIIDRNIADMSRNRDRTMNNVKHEESYSTITSKS